jgi:glycolate oxidase
MLDRLGSTGIKTREETGRAIALPATAQETSAVVDLAREEGWVVTPHWAAPSAEAGVEPGGSSGRRPALYISPERLKGIDEVIPADMMGVVAAGVTVGALEERIGADGLCWPPASNCDPDSMVGDIIARLPGGWTMEGNLARRYLLALEAVMPDGSIMSAGARTVKSVTGYDLKQLVVGSHGTLGVITSLTLRLEALANRESVLERYRRDFAGMESAAASASANPGEPGSAGGDGAMLILERLKRELDPEGVFPFLGILMGSDTRA